MNRTIILLLSLMFVTLNLKGQISEDDLTRLVEKMTLEQKAALCSGADFWSTKAIPELDIPSVRMSDGPHGLRCAPSSDVPGFGTQHPATAYPTASAMAATWNPSLIQQVGKAIGQEALTQNVDIVLAPGANIKRSPRGGRNFEYYSEDPLLSGTMAAAFINGVQSLNVGTSLKHFACNNAEYKRMQMSSIVDERTMREIYLKSFEIAVKQANPTTIMAAYNRVNGEYATQHRRLLTDILREEWEYPGVVISDWISVVDRVKGVKAGMNIEMPGSDGVNDKKIVEAVKAGDLKESTLNELVRETLRMTMKMAELHEIDATFDKKEHHELAHEVANEAITLLKNEGDVLPLTSAKYKNVAVIGAFAKNPRFQGGGSSEVKPTMVDTAYQVLTNKAGESLQTHYAQGYYLKQDSNLSLIDDAVQAAKDADVAVVFAGLPLHYETEGRDREHLSIPHAQNELIRRVAEVQENTAVVLTNGSAVVMPWEPKVKGILETWLNGQARALATVDALLGNTNPSGKLAETFPQLLEHSPSYLNFPGDNRQTLYGEGVFVGYRYFDTKQIAPLFPFGHGLSYTNFAYTSLDLSTKELAGNESLKASLTVKNTGDRKGSEVLQLYVHDPKAGVKRPDQELKAFKKVSLEPGESSTFTLEISPEDLAYYDGRRNMWVTESGTYEIRVGSSSRDIRQKMTFHYTSRQEIPLAFDELTLLRRWFENPQTKPLIMEIIRPYLEKNSKSGETADPESLDEFILGMPVVKLPYITSGIVTDKDVNELVRKVEDFTVQP